MSNRTIAKQTEAALPARLRADLYEGQSTELGDRRAISIFAMFALDEPEDRTPTGAVLGDEGIVAFLPEVCTPAFARR